jgi:hypothetical protein
MIWIYFLFRGGAGVYPTAWDKFGFRENKRAVRREPAAEMLTGRAPATGALPGVFRRQRERRAAGRVEK